jgi:hypothetical protein
VYQMYERTSLCPYTEKCESYQTILRAERWMEHALSKLRREARQGVSSYCGYTVEALNWRLEHMNRVKDRCYNRNGCCLRFWQFRAKEERESSLRHRITDMLRQEFAREAAIKLFPDEGLAGESI